jgi:hypothetical protein
VGVYIVAGFRMVTAGSTTAVGSWERNIAQAPEDYEAKKLNNFPGKSWGWLLVSSAQAAESSVASAMVAMRADEVLSGKDCWSTWKTRPLGRLQYALFYGLNGETYPLSLFLVICRHLRYASLPIDPCGLKWKLFGQCLKRLGVWGEPGDLQSLFLFRGACEPRYSSPV